MPKQENPLTLWIPPPLSELWREVTETLQGGALKSRDPGAQTFAKHRVLVIAVAVGLLLVDDEPDALIRLQQKKAVEPQQGKTLLKSKATSVRLTPSLEQAFTNPQGKPDWLSMHAFHLRVIEIGLLHLKAHPDMAERMDTRISEERQESRSPQGSLITR